MEPRNIRWNLQHLMVSIHIYVSHDCFPLFYADIPDNVWILCTMYLQCHQKTSITHLLHRSNRHFWLNWCCQWQPRCHTIQWEPMKSEDRRGYTSKGIRDIHLKTDHRCRSEGRQGDICIKASFPYRTRLYSPYVLSPAMPSQNKEHQRNKAVLLLLHLTCIPHLICINLNS